MAAEDSQGREGAERQPWRCLLRLLERQLLSRGARVLLRRSLRILNRNQGMLRRRR